MKIQGVVSSSLCPAVCALFLFAFEAFPATHFVQALHNSFNPSTLQINAGDTVTWINVFDELHTITSSSPIPAWGERFLFDEEDEESLLFNSPGTFPYHCRFHAGMTGSIVVTGGNTAPTVSIVSPTNNSSFFEPATVTITAEAFDSDGTVAQVEFLSNLSSVGVASNGVNNQFSLTVSNLVSGDYALTARATDDQGAATTSTSIFIQVVSRPEIRLDQVERLADGSFRFVVFGGSSGQTAVIQASQNLADWNSISTNVFPSTVCPTCPFIEYTDESAPATSHRFFRALVYP